MILGNLACLIILIEIVFRLYPKAMPDFPQWNYNAHHTYYKKDVLDRLDEIGQEKKAVVFLGDSFTRGAEVERGREWVALVQKKSKGMELVNMGFNGSAQLEEDIYFKEFIVKSNAEISGVVLSFYRNDFLDNIEHEKIFQKSGVDPFLNRLKKEMVDERRFGNLRKFLDTHVYSYRLLKWALKGTSSYMRTPPTETHVYLERPGVYYDWEQGQFPWNLPENYKEITATYLDQLRFSVKEAGVPFVILYLPSKLVVYQEEIESIDRKKDFNFVHEERKFLREYSEKNKVPFYDFTDIFYENRFESVYLEIDSHWSEYGHKIMATEFLRRSVLDNF